MDAIVLWRRAGVAGAGSDTCWMSVRGMRRAPTNDRATPPGWRDLVGARVCPVARFDDLELVPGALLPERWAQLEELITVENPASYAVSDQTLLERDGRFAVHWLPFERLNAHAPVALVGLTPGRGQAAMAFGAAKSAMEDGATPRELLERVGRRAAFGGPMRTVLVRRLDGIGLPTALGVQSTGELFADANSLVHMTSALRYTTLRDGKNYGGRASEVGSLPILRNRILCSLAPELQAVPRALVIPLGVAVSAALRVLTDGGLIEEHRCLFGFPHPSTGSGYVDRERAYEARRYELSAAVDRWFATDRSRRRVPARPRTAVAVPGRGEYEPIDDVLWRKVRQTAADLLAGTAWNISNTGRGVLDRVCETRGTRDLLGYWGVSDVNAREAATRRGRLPQEIAAAMGEDRAAQFPGGHARPKALLVLATALSKHTRHRH